MRVVWHGLPFVNRDAGPGKSPGRRKVTSGSNGTLVRKSSNSTFQENDKTSCFDAESFVLLPPELSN